MILYYKNLNYLLPLPSPLKTTTLESKKTSFASPVPLIISTTKILLFWLLSHHTLTTADIGVLPHPFPIHPKSRFTTTQKFSLSHPPLLFSRTHTYSNSRALRTPITAPMDSPAPARSKKVTRSSSLFLKSLTDSPSVPSKTLRTTPTSGFSLDSMTKNAATSHLISLPKNVMITISPLTPLQLKSSNSSAVN